MSALRSAAKAVSEAQERLKMVLPLSKYGEKVLREKAFVVSSVTPELSSLAEDMVETMHETGGVGLAAQQIGRTERLCVIDIPENCEEDEDRLFNAPISMPLKLFNPQILSREGVQCDKEGCLSFPGISGEIVRAYQVVCRFVDENNVPQTITARGFLARAIQHEVDHLDGVLFIDRMTAPGRLRCSTKLKKLAKANGGVR